MNIKQRHFVKSTEIKTLKADILNHYDQDFIDSIFPKKCRVEVIITEEGDTLFSVNNVLKLWKSKEGYVPVLTLLIENRVQLRSVIVDLGAIRFLSNGADLMRPGITRIDPQIRKGEIIRIADEKQNRAIAVGKALMDSEEMEKKTSGKVVKNLHCISDKVWKYIKAFS